MAGDADSESGCDEGARTGTIPHVWVGPVPLLVAKSDKNNYLTVLSTFCCLRCCGRRVVS
eukprot:880116-Prymnesium_polylepis.1